MAIGLEAVLNDKNFQDGLKRYTSGLSQMESASTSTANVISRVGALMTGGLVVGVGAAVTAFGAFSAAAKIGLDSTIAWGEQLDRLGDQFGFSGEKASAFTFAANRVGLSIDEMGMGLNTLTRGLDDMQAALKDPKAKPTAFAQALATLGVKATNAKGRLKTVDELLPDLMDKFKKLPPGIKTSALAMDLFGARGGSKFLDFLRQGSKGLDDARKKSKLLGLELTTKEIDAIEEFGFTMNELGLAIKGAWNQIGIQVLPVLQEFVGLIVDNFPDITQFAKNFGRELADVMQRVSFVLQSFFNLISGTGSIDDFAADIATLANKFGLDGVVIEKVVRQITEAIQGFVQAFQRGGLSGVIDELGRQLGNAFKGFDAATLLGNIGNAIVTELPKMWAKIQPELAKWGNQFWSWLTGEGQGGGVGGSGKAAKSISGGVIGQIQTQFGNVIAAIAKWLSDERNTTPIWNALKSWAEMFWVWLTDPQKGALITVATQMQKLIDQIRIWSEDPKTAEQFHNIGATVANEILDGIGRIFDNPGEGENIIQRLIRTLWNAAQSARAAAENIGANLASGITEGIARRFFDANVARQIGDAIGNLFRAAFEYAFSPVGPIGAVIARAIQGIYNSIMQIINLLGRLSSGGGTSGFGGGGGGARGSIGSAASPLVQQPVITNNSTARNVSVSFAPGAFAGAFSGSGLNASSVEEIATAIANKTVAAVLNAT